MKNTTILPLFHPLDVRKSKFNDLNSRILLTGLEKKWLDLWIKINKKLEEYGKNRNSNERDNILNLLLKLRKKIEKIEYDLDEIDKCPFKLDKISNTLIFKDVMNASLEDEVASCTITINVALKPMKTSKGIDYWFYEVSFTHKVIDTPYSKGIYNHPLYNLVFESKDESLYEGYYIAANEITYESLKILLESNGKNSTNVSTGSRPFIDYQGEIMRSLTEIQN